MKVLLYILSILVHQIWYKMTSLVFFGYQVSTQQHLKTHFFWKIVKQLRFCAKVRIINWNVKDAIFLPITFQLLTFHLGKKITWTCMNFTFNGTIIPRKPFQEHFKVQNMTNITLGSYSLEKICSALIFSFLMEQ